MALKYYFSILQRKYILQNQEYFFHLQNSFHLGKLGFICWVKQIISYSYYMVSIQRISFQEEFWKVTHIFPTLMFWQNSIQPAMSVIVLTNSLLVIYDVITFIFYVLAKKHHFRLPKPTFIDCNKIQYYVAKIHNGWMP